MDLTSLGIVSVVPIVILCYAIGLFVKNIQRIDNKWIPSICGAFGTVFGLIGIVVMPDFPANDYLTAAAIGCFSGLAATGIDQIGKQLKTTK